MNIGAVMDQIAARIRLAPSLTGRTYAYPAATITPPAAIVNYPGAVAYDQSARRGRDRLEGTFVVFIGRPHEKPSRDLLTRYADGTGPESLKALVEGDSDIYTACDGVSVDDAAFDVFEVASVPLLVAVFNWTAYGPGA